MPREAWGTWGDEDERGALNHIGPSEVRAAVQLVREGRALEDPSGLRWTLNEKGDN